VLLTVVIKEFNDIKALASYVIASDKWYVCGIIFSSSVANAPKERVVLSIYLTLDSLISPNNLLIKSLAYYSSLFISGVKIDNNFCLISSASTPNFLEAD
jgi:hypothetical protein